ncbi:hypothetical protein [Anaplasma phagocytophilum]|uniref:hypothetical protein n=1 Tax=Anaplasma phagocytophilum TaxID=948 RepID=UPI0011A30938|nr:hypothetical protein [Anaplasma phagocytophilum]
MMLLLDRLITLLLLLPKPLVKTSFSLLILWIFLIPVLVRRFVRRLGRVAVTSMVYMQILQVLSLVTMIRRCVVTRGEQGAVVVIRRRLSKSL